MNLMEDIVSLGAISGPVYLAIGVFDGLHKGHQEVLGNAVASAKKNAGTAVLVTFDPHPRTVLASSSAPRLLTSTRHKLVLLQRLGIEHVLLIHFDEDFSRLPAEHFVSSLVDACQDLREITVGGDWIFGYQRSGNLELLKRMGKDLDFRAVGVEPVCEKEKIISSTSIRQAVEEGDVLTASALLGRDYTVLGTVVEGKRLGRTIGFPTANLSVHNEQMPPSGVYAAIAARDSGEGSRHVALVNLGHRPTVEGDQGSRLLEVFLLDFDEEIYGEDLEITFVKFLREEKKFSSLDDLKAQISDDETRVRQLGLATD